MLSVVMSMYTGAKTVVRTVYGNSGCVEVKVGMHQGSPAHFTRRCCLSVCLSVTLLNVRVCAPDFAMKALEYRNDFDAVGYK